MSSLCEQRVTGVDTCNREALQFFRLSREECSEFYTPCYCEENVWHLLKLASIRDVPQNQLFAVFISNGKRCVPFQKQKSGASEGNGLCLWDYHVVPVIISETGKGELQDFVYDFDSTLPFPCTLEMYVRESITAPLPNGASYAEVCQLELEHMFRVVSYPDILKHFSSDRRHMRSDSSNWKMPGVPEYNSPAPAAPCISALAHQHPHALPVFLRMPGALEDGSLAVPSELADMKDPGTLLQGPTQLLHFFEVTCPSGRSTNTLSDQLRGSYAG